MSRIGKKVISLPPGTSISMRGQSVSVTGKLGALSLTVPPEISVQCEGTTVRVEPVRRAQSRPRGGGKTSTRLWGTWRSLLQNAVTGVSQGFSKSLIVEGLGFVAEAKGNVLSLKLGYSHPITVPVPEGLSVTAEKNIVTVSGTDRQRTGQFAAKIRAIKPPEPYHGKGIRYREEVIVKKQIKKV